MLCSWWSSVGSIAKGAKTCFYFQKHTPLSRQNHTTMPLHTAQIFWYQVKMICSQMFERGEVILWNLLSGINNTSKSFSWQSRHHIEAPFEKCKMCNVKQTVFWIYLFWICILAEVSATQGCQWKKQIQWRLRLRFIKELYQKQNIRWLTGLVSYSPPICVIIKCSNSLSWHKLT